MSPVAPLLRLENFSIGYDKPLLQNISAQFGPGVAGIIGNNGKGKTTLLKALCGLLAPASGKVILQGKDLFSFSNEERARMVSFNFSSNSVSFPITVHELVAMGRYPYINQWAGLSPGDETIVNEALELCGIAAFSDKKVNALSDGEKQKVFIAKSIAQQTDLLLFDEPTAFLDYSSKKYFFGLMKKIAAERNKIILVSSHDIDFLTSYTDSILMIEDDETVLSGTSADVMSSAYFKTHFTKV